MVSRTSRPGLTFRLEERYPTSNEVGDLLGISRRTLDRHQKLQGGPAYYKFGNRVRYRIADLDAWTARYRINNRRKREVRAGSRRCSKPPLSPEPPVDPRSSTAAPDAPATQTIPQGSLITSPR